MMSGTLPTNTILDKIVAAKVREVERIKRERKDRDSSRLASLAPEGGLRRSRNFIDSIKEAAENRRAIIAEIKKASPSAGVLREPFDPEALARAYEANGAAAISVITDAGFFQGSLAVLEAVRGVTELPLLRKDFMIDAVQLEDAAAAGADAALLIARILSDGLFQDLYDAAAGLGLDVLVEVHDQTDLERTLALTPVPELIGVNNRDLADFSVSVERTLDLMPLMPEGALVVSESGLSDAATLDRLRRAGVGAFLIGTSLMRAPEPGKLLRNLVGD